VQGQAGTSTLPAESQVGRRACNGPARKGQLVLRLEQGPVVLVSSRLGLVCVTADRSPRKEGHRQQSRFLRTYARKLPSSLTRDHSSTLVSSTCLPVSDTLYLDGFSRQDLQTASSLPEGIDSWLAPTSIPTTGLFLGPRPR
jgi:hypothetical protein